MRWIFMLWVRQLTCVPKRTIKICIEKTYLRRMRRRPRPWRTPRATVQQPNQRRRARKEVGQGVIVEGAQERVFRPLQRALESARRFDRARVAGRSKHSTRSQLGSVVRISVPTLISRGGFLSRRRPPCRPRTLVTSPLLDQELDHLHHDVRRHAVGAADLADGDEAIVVQGQVDQEAQRVVRELGQLHTRKRTLNMYA